MKQPETKEWRGMKLVRISDAGIEFDKFLCWKTSPVVEDDVDPMDWAYECDYDAYVNSLVKE